MVYNDTHMPTGDGAERPDSEAGSDTVPPEVSLTRSDERVLAYLADAGADYPALVAGNTGLYASHVETRLDVLAQAGLVEAATGETVYRITDDGRDALDDDRATWSG
jgi:hypothetical protein